MGTVSDRGAALAMFAKLLAAADTTTPAATGVAVVPVPSRLAAAAHGSLEADGAAISLLSQPGIRMPVAFSGPDAALAEQLQSTLGEGPALDALRLGIPLLANESMTSTSWPQFYQQLSRRTPLRAVASIPLSHGGVRIGVLDLYYIAQIQLAGFPVDGAQQIADVIAARLVADHYFAGSNDLGPSWLINEATRPRREVSVAMAIVCMHVRVTAEQALQLLRSHATITESTLDAVSLEVTSGRLAAHQLQAARSAQR